MPSPVRSDSARPAPRPGLLDIVPYAPGKAPEARPGRKVYKLSANESGLGASPAAMAAFAEAVRLETYPDGASRKLKAAIAELHGLPPANLFVGAGSDEVIELLCRAYAGEGRSVVQTRHGFSYYHLAARAAGSEPLFAEERDLTADVDAILATVRDDTALVFLANPNNPTGTLLPKEEVARLRAELPAHVMLCYDGAYAEYMTPGDTRYTDGFDLVAEAIRTGADNVVATRTFSKIYGLGGLRVGWALAPESVVGVMDRLRSPFNVNAPALAAAEAALRDQDFVDRNRAHNQAERERVAGELRKLGFEVPESHANFVLPRMRGGSAEAREAEHDALLSHLAREGIMVRSQKAAWLPEHLRVSIGSVEANDAFLAAVREYVS